MESKGVQSWRKWRTISLLQKPLKQLLIQNRKWTEGIKLATLKQEIGYSRRKHSCLVCGAKITGKSMQARKYKMPFCQAHILSEVYKALQEKYQI